MPDKSYKDNLKTRCYNFSISVIKTLDKIEVKRIHNSIIDQLFVRQHLLVRISSRLNPPALERISLNIMKSPSNPLTRRNTGFVF